MLSTRVFHVGQDAQTDLVQAFDALGLDPIVADGHSFYRLDQTLQALGLSEAEALAHLREERIHAIPGRPPIRAIGEGSVHRLSVVGTSRAAERLREAIAQALNAFCRNIELTEQLQGKPLAQVNESDNL